MPALVKKLLSILPKDKRLRLCGLLFLFVVMGIMELIGIASILPLIQILAKPDLIETNGFLSHLFDISGANSVAQFMVMLSACVLGILILVNSFMAFAQYTILRFGASCDYDLSVELIKKYIAQPYAFFTARHSSELIKNALQEVTVVTYQVIIPLLTVLSRTIVALFIVALLFYSEPYLAIIIAVFFGALYLGIYSFYKKKSHRIGQERLAANTIRYKIANEIFTGIKDIKAIGAEESYYHSIKPAAKQFCFASAKNQMMRQIPKYFIEIAAFGSIILIIMYFIGTQKDMNDILPLLSLYAIAGYRLMPSLQQIFANALQLRFARPTLDLLHKEFQSLDKIPLPKPSSR